MSSMIKRVPEKVHTRKPARRVALCAVFATMPAIADAQQTREPAPNQTEAYGAGELLNFTYTQNFMCVEQPKNDLNFNNVAAQSDPNEVQSPICQVSSAA